MGNLNHHVLKKCASNEISIEQCSFKIRSLHWVMEMGQHWVMSFVRVESKWLFAVNTSRPGITGLC